MLLALGALSLSAPPTMFAQYVPEQPVSGSRRPTCMLWEPDALRRNPTTAELRCRYDIRGPGRFGLAAYMDVPVYQPITPLPGTHVVGVAGLPGPRQGESFEEWEWRVLRTEYSAAERQANRGLEVLDPFFASRILHLEQRLRDAGVRFGRRETWRSPQRQAFLFQQGRSRPGPLATATLTSWHSRVDVRGMPSARAADYNVSARQMPRFHEIAWEVGLESYGPDSNDPGHVFLPEHEDFPNGEVVLLRLLPRVPVVTLATGRPTDETVSRDQRALWRAASEEFASFAFVPHPVARLAVENPRVDGRYDPVTVSTAPLAKPDPPRSALGALLGGLRRR